MYMWFVWEKLLSKYGVRPNTPHTDNGLSIKQNQCTAFGPEESHRASLVFWFTGCVVCRDDEQERGITMKSSSISLLYVPGAALRPEVSEEHRCVWLVRQTHHIQLNGYVLCLALLLASGYTATCQIRFSLCVYILLLHQCLYHKQTWGSDFVSILALRPCQVIFRAAWARWLIHT